MRLGFLNHDNYQIYNRDLARKLGSIHAAIFLCELISRFEFHCKHSPDEILTKDGDSWFYYTHECGIKRLVMSRKEQDTVIKILISHGLIKKRVFQLPAKRFFCINEDKLLQLFDLSKNVSRLSEPNKLNCPKGTTSHIQRTLSKEPNKNVADSNPLMSKAANATPTTPSEASQMCKYLFEKIKRLFPKTKNPDFKIWEREMRLLHERDKRPWEEIQSTIDWIFESDFWCRNILSVAKLRKQYDTIQAQIVPVLNKGSNAKINKSLAIRIKDLFAKDGVRCNLHLLPDLCLAEGEEVPFDMDTSKFEEKLFLIFKLRRTK